MFTKDFGAQELCEEVSVDVKHRERRHRQIQDPRNCSGHRQGGGPGGHMVSVDLEDSVFPIPFFLRP